MKRNNGRQGVTANLSRQASADQARLIGRRGLFKLAAAGAVAGALSTRAAEPPLGPATRPSTQPTQPTLPPLANHQPPALQFQVYPGGTASYLEKLAKERGKDTFARTPFQIDPWDGPVPTSEDQIAFLPIH